MLETHPDRLHVAGGVSNSSARLNIVDSNGFGLANCFDGRCYQGKYQERDALYIHTKTGIKIVLISGGGKEGDEKFVKGNSYGCAYITEVNECAPSFVKEIFDRTLSSKNRKLFLDLNPKAPTHWFYEDLLKFHQENQQNNPNYGLNYEHFTLLDNCSFTDEKIREILSTYDHTSIWYKRDILGQRSNVEGIIYDMFNYEKHSYDDGGPGSPNFDFYFKRFFSIDYGTTNPFVILEIIEQTDLITGITYYYVDDCYYYDSAKHDRQKDDSQYVDDLREFVGNKRYTTIVLDPSAASFKVAARQKGFRIIDADNDVMSGIHLVSQLLQNNRLRFNKARCKPGFDEMASYIWDTKAAERGVEVPVKKFDHFEDALRYYCKTIIKVMR